jgi:hypothetical protein
MQFMSGRSKQAWRFRLTVLRARLKDFHPTLTEALTIGIHVRGSNSCALCTLPEQVAYCEAGSDVEPYDPGQFRQQIIESAEVARFSEIVLNGALAISRRNIALAVTHRKSGYVNVKAISS